MTPAAPALLDPHRLAALDDVMPLDLDAALGGLTDLAAVSLNAPFAMVNLIDAARQITICQAGIAGDPAERPLERSLCRHTVESGEPLLIVDARADPAFAHSPALTELGVVAYLGIPLITSDGLVLGTLCAIDVAPRRWGEIDIAVLRGLAVAAMREIEARAAARRAGGAAPPRLGLATDGLAARDRSLDGARIETVRRLARATELRSEETGAHIAAMSRLCAALALRLGWPRDRAEALALAGALHDVGKIAIPDEILHKPGALAPHERLIVETHAQIGHDMLAGSGDELLDLAAMIALTHHERMDGTGYPRGLRGEAIPVEGRIAAVADVFEALTSDRSYRSALPLGRALQIMEDGRGAHFDPEVLDALLAEVAEGTALAEAAASEVRGPAGQASPRRHASDDAP